MKNIPLSRKIFTVLITVSCLAVGCASCQLVQDQDVAPSSLSQFRLPIQIGNDVEIGIHGVAGANTTVQVQSFGKGTVEIRGLGKCGYISSTATNDVGWVSFNTADLPPNDFCLYNLQANTNGFDAPAIGQLIVRRFTDPNIQPLQLTANGVTRSGVNWVQVAAAGTKTLDTAAIGGINELRDIELNLGGHSGNLVVTDCKGNTTSTVYTNATTFTTSIDALYNGAPVNSTCLFTITANHTNAIAQSANLLVAVYQKFGSFLDAPIVNDNCFSFTDPYAVGISVNGQWSLKSSGQVSLCADKADTYQVEGVTSNQRIFFGVSDGTTWTEMQ